MSIDKALDDVSKKALGRRAFGGFLLVELIIAIALFSVTILTIFQYKWSMIRLCADSYKRLKAIDLATEAIEKIMRNKKISDISGEKGEYCIAAWTTAMRSESALPLKRRCKLSLVNRRARWRWRWWPWDMQASGACDAREYRYNIASQCHDPRRREPAYPGP